MLTFNHFTIAINLSQLTGQNIFSNKVGDLYLTKLFKLLLNIHSAHSKRQKILNICNKTTPITLSSLKKKVILTLNRPLLAAKVP